MKRPPRGTGICQGCGRRILLATNGKLLLHAHDPRLEPEKRVRCPDSLTRHYEPGPDYTYTETP